MKCAVGSLGRSANRSRAIVCAYPCPRNVFCSYTGLIRTTGYGAGRYSRFCKDRVIPGVPVMKHADVIWSFVRPRASGLALRRSGFSRSIRKTRSIDRDLE
jgi:hypothetical protein